MLRVRAAISIRFRWHCTALQIVNMHPVYVLL